MMFLAVLPTTWQSSFNEQQTSTTAWRIKTVTFDISEKLMESRMEYEICDRHRTRGIAVYKPSFRVVISRTFVRETIIKPFEAHFRSSNRTF